MRGKYNYKEVLDFWFRKIEPSMWFAKDEAFDTEIRDRFGAYYEAAIRGELYDWRETIHGRLAEIIILDQFARNMFRKNARAFAYDSLALVLSQEALATGAVDELTDTEHRFLLMPWMHSESREIHERALELFTDLGQEKVLGYEKRHKAIIDRFGRYPHRNEVLARGTTLEEVEFLQEFPGF